MELTEKQKNCPYCHIDKQGNTEYVYIDFGEGIRVFPDGVIECDYDDDGMPSMMCCDAGTINYCPMCGRPLGCNEDESI